MKKDARPDCNSSDASFIDFVYFFPFFFSPSTSWWIHFLPQLTNHHNCTNKALHSVIFFLLHNFLFFRLLFIQIRPRRWASCRLIIACIKMSFEYRWMVSRSFRRALGRILCRSTNVLSIAGGEAGTQTLKISRHLGGRLRCRTAW